MLEPRADQRLQVSPLDARRNLAFQPLPGIPRTLDQLHLGHIKPGHGLHGSSRIKPLRERKSDLRFIRVDPCKSVANYVCSTPTLNSGTSGFSAAASRACVIASRVSMGSIILSIHNRAAPYLGSVCSS